LRRKRIKEPLTLGDIFLLDQIRISSLQANIFQRNVLNRVIMSKKKRKKVRK